MDKIDRIISTILVVILSVLSGLLIMSLFIYFFGIEEITDKALVACIGTMVSTLIWDKILLKEED